jgi:glycosyltransferase involved in cell wall biosynthesis
MRARASALRLADRVLFAGHVPMESLPELYRTAFAHVNLSRTGSLDKSILESLAAGCPVLTSNDAARDLLSAHPDLWLDDDEPRRVAERLRVLYDRRGERNRQALRALVVPRHDLGSYACRIHRELEDLVHARKA